VQQKYQIVAGSFLTQFAIIGMLFSYGVFFSAFEAEFGWSRTLLSLASSIGTLMMGVMASVLGSLADRFGPRRVLLVTGPIYAIGFVLMSQITAPWQLFLIFASFVGIGLGSHDVITLSTVSRWFSARRGIMSGVVKTGTAAGQVVLPFLAALMIASLGWRQALVVLGIATGVILVLAALMMSHPKRAPSNASVDGNRDGSSFAEARRSRVFWTLASIQFLFFVTVISVPVHIAVHGMDLGMSTARAALLLSTLGAASALGRLGVGWTVDRIGGRLALILCLAILSASLGCLIVTEAQALLFAVIAAYGFAHGGLFTVVSPTVAGVFGNRAHGAIFGAILLSGTIGGATGPVLVGLAFDVLGSYQPAFVTLTLLSALAFGLALSLPKPVRGG